MLIQLLTDSADLKDMNDTLSQEITNSSKISNSKSQHSPD